MCTKCQGYKTMPYSWNTTTAPMMCTCPKPVSLLGTLAWECTRCHKINAPWKGSCDCTPSPLSSAPTSDAQPSKYLIDEIGQYNFNGPHKEYWNNILNKNFTDK